MGIRHRPLHDKTLSRIICSDRGARNCSLTNGDHLQSANWTVDRALVETHRNPGLFARAKLVCRCWLHFSGSLLSKRRIRQRGAEKSELLRL